MAAAASSGLSVLVTRPGDRGIELCNRLKRESICAFHFPVLKIRPIEIGKADRDHLLDHDILVFVSPNAVVHGLAGIDYAAIRTYRGLACAPGRGTAEMLRNSGFISVVAPSAQSNSEELLKLPELETLDGRSVLILRGESGRELLATTLRERGATVEYLAVYRRETNLADTDILDAWLQCGDAVVLLPSGEAVTGLLRQIPGKLKPAVLHATALVPGARVAGFCRAEGWQGKVVIIENPANDTVLKALATL